MLTFVSTGGITHDTLVAQCIAEKLTLETLPLEQYQAACPLFAEDVYDAIALETCLNGRISEGGPSASAVQEQLSAAKAAIGAIIV